MPQTSPVASTRPGVSEGNRSVVVLVGRYLALVIKCNVHYNPTPDPYRCKM